MDIKFHDPGRKIIFVITLSMLLQPAIAVTNECPDDDLDADVVWVGIGSTSLAWSTAYGFEADDAVYIIRASDFNQDLSAALISIEKDGAVEKKVLYLDTRPGDDWFNWDAEIRVELTGITTDAHETPSAHLDLYRGEKPRLNIEIGATSETHYGTNVSSDQYAPGKEKTIAIEVKNTGGAWIEDVAVWIDIGELKLVDQGFEFHDQMIYESLGCMENGDAGSINFTVAAPAWNGVTSPYRINYTISVSAEGIDIQEMRYCTNESLTLSCTDPQLLVTQSVCYDEISMSRCNLISSNRSLKEIAISMPEALIYNVSEWSIVEAGIRNIGFYPLYDLNITDPPIPDGFRVAEVHEEGSLTCVSKEHPYHIRYKLVPTKPGRHAVNATVVRAEFYGTKHSWRSDGATITVHGPHIKLTKTITEPGNGMHRVALNLRNDGDRAALVDLTDTIPLYARYTEGGMDEGTGIPTGGDFDLRIADDSYLLMANDILLEPEQSIGFSYHVQSDRELNLSRAEAWFIARNDYGGVVFSSILGLPVAVPDYNVTSENLTSENVTSENVTSGNRSNQSEPLPPKVSTPAFENMTGVLPTNASGPKDEPEGRNLFDLLVYAAIGIVVLAAAFMLWGRIARKQKGNEEGVDDGLSWAVSSIRKTGSEYEITVTKNSKKKTIKLNEKFYKKLIKDKKLTFGKQTIFIPHKKG
ncbi:MAG: hypothetical protein U9Q68_05805 [Euryarchaeota archaeon]|nr:hypothetical protein [Euryarchaeota archaeon]